MTVARDTLGIGLAGVFAGIAVLLAVVALATQPFLLLASLPFVAAAYLLWLAGTGRTPFWRESRPGAARTARANQERREPGHSQNRFGPEARRDAAGGGMGSGRRRRGRQSDTLARREAAHVLGVDVDADPAAVRNAYRESVKEVHPDAEGGDEEAFQRVNEAYERFQEEP